MSRTRKKKLVVKRERRPVPVGKRYGSLVIVRYEGHDRKDKYVWCRCDRKQEKAIRFRCLQAGQKTCGKCNLKAAQHHAWRGCGELSKNLFNTYRNGAKARGYSFRVTVEEAWAAYEKQGGKCAYTGWPLFFNKTYRDQKNRTASLDRINSKRGYTKDNIHWVHRDVNKLKKNMGHEAFLKLCRAVAAYRRE